MESTLQKYNGQLFNEKDAHVPMYFNCLPDCCPVTMQQYPAKFDSAGFEGSYSDLNVSIVWVWGKMHGRFEPKLLRVLIKIIS